MRFVIVAITAPVSGTISPLKNTVSIWMHEHPATLATIPTASVQRKATVQTTLILSISGQAL
jgi:hypothetical protein